MKTSKILSTPIAYTAFHVSASPRMVKVEDRIYSSVQFPRDWHDYLIFDNKQKVLLTSMNCYTGHIRTESLDLMCAWLTARHRKNLKRYSKYTFYIQHT